ncbi:type II toxin-antitoxin system RelE/ParE family toxin [Oceanispirochaeta sp.]|uniref:type II toxin-antitoxin system RelE family toxin n=1 Tax=Oceanispirochaeta sp. TaxID=2035350 RepID=UPI0026330063|nr:type II toxin-antitoxin system RelE/ParE family toxin [Oceanispirochaeta sp.]MDA3957990.1 type II toxin-antitoxin system RelE/ParE family toxin [Oceanispirochaeta sp.]
MAWSVDFTATARKQLKKIDRKWLGKILDYLEDEVATLEHPKDKGKALVGDKKGLWRYRVGDYRIICDILDHEIVILVVIVGPRKNVYSD